MATETVEIFRVDLDAGKIAADLNKIKAASKELRTERKVLDAQLRFNQISEKEYTKAIAANTTAVAINSQAQTKTNRELKAATKAATSATGSLEQQRAILSRLTTKYDSLSKSQRTNSEQGKALQKEILKVNDGLKDQEEATGRSQRNVGNYGDALKGLTGNLTIMGTNVGGIITKLTAFGAAARAQAAATVASTAATGGATKGLKLFRLALIGTGIGAIVIGLGLLVAAFASTQKGIDFITRKLKPFQVAFEKIVDFLQKKALKAFENPKQALKDLGDFIVGQFTNRIKALKNIFTGVGGALKSLVTGDFAGVKRSLKEIGSNIVDFGTGVENTIAKTINTVEDLQIALDNIKKTANQLTDLEINAEEIEIRNAELIPALEREAEALKLIAANTLKTAAERKKAGLQAIEVLNKIAKAEGELIDSQVKRQEIENTLNDTGREGLREIAELRAKNDVIIAARDKKTKLIQGQIISAIKEEIAAEKKKGDEIKKANANANKILDKLRDENTLAAIADANERAKKELEIALEASEAELKLLKVSKTLKKEIAAELQKEFNREIAAIDKAAKEEQDKIDEEDKLKDILKLQADAEAREELAVLEAEGLQEMGDAKLELLRVQQENELAQFKGSKEEIALLEAQHQQKIQALEKQTRDIQIKSNLEKAKSFGNLFSTIAGLFEDNASLQKAAALFQIGVDTAVALAGAVRQAQTAGPFPANIAAIGIGVTAVLANIAKAKQILSGASFEEGGIAIEGGNIPASGGMITGKTHADGGVKFNMGGGAIGEAQKGEAYIVNIGGNPLIKQAASNLNVAGGGKAFTDGGVTHRFQDGGGISSSFGTSEANDFIEALQELNISVSVEEIRRENAKFADVQDTATL